MFKRVPFSMQDIIKKYTNISDRACNHAALASALGSLTWEKPLHSEFQKLARYKCLIKCNDIDRNIQSNVQIVVKIVCIISCRV